MRSYSKEPGLWQHEIATSFDSNAEAVILSGDCLMSLNILPNSFAKLIITSPPYNIGKVYEEATDMAEYLDKFNPIIEEYVRVLSSQGSLCWLVGNDLEVGEVFQLEMSIYRILKK